MPKPYLITPSIERADFTQLGRQIAEAEEAGADWLHIDVMDGHFVPNITLGTTIVEACKQASHLPLDVHLMVEEPEHLVENFAIAGASHLTIHPEASPNLVRTLQAIIDLGCKAGVAINPGTPAEAVRPALQLVHNVLVMTVNPGYSGQKFIAEVMPKITQVRTWLDEVNPEAHVQVDGGIDGTTIRIARDAGADAFVAATAVFKHPQGIKAGIRALRDGLTN
jgi:ribulose-phosphate 3-epimerase